MLEERARGQEVEVAAVAGEAFRVIAAPGYPGAVSLVVGGTALLGDGWRHELAGLTQLLRELVDCLVYGRVLRGWSALDALTQPGTADDWPQRPDDHPRGASNVVLDDLLAADVFGVQLLGAGYAGRVPAHPAWSIERVGVDSVLLEHVDPAAWFAAPFVPFRQHVRPERRPQPPVLIEARGEMAPILYSPGALADLGYPDMGDRWRRSPKSIG